MIACEMCKGCERRLPATSDFFPLMRWKRKDGTRAVKLRPRCRDCVRVDQRTHTRRYNERNRTDPARAEKRERRLAQMRERRDELQRTDPERLRAINLKSKRRRRQNSAARKAEREAERMRRRLQREREGVPLEAIKSNPGAMLNSIENGSELAASFERLPSAPLAAALRREDQRRYCSYYAGWTIDVETDRMEAARASEDAGIGVENMERTVFAWESGERMHVQFDIVDRILTALGWCWWDVYSPETVRKRTLQIEHLRPINSAKAVGVRHFKDRASMEALYALDEHGVYGTPIPARKARYATSRRVLVGDEGPDLEALEQIRHVFECVGLPHCTTCRDKRENEESQMVLGEAA